MIIKITDVGINSNDLFFVRVNNIVTDKKAQIEVPQTHNALVIKGGESKFFTNGVYPIFDDKKEIKDWKRGVSVEVIYVPKDTVVPISWGTRERFPYLDPLTGKLVSVGARGYCSVHIVNIEKFFRKVVGVKTEFSADDFSDRFRVEIVNEFTSNFLNVVNTLGFSMHQFAQLNKPIAQEMEKVINPKFSEKWGIQVEDFNIENINIEDEDKEKINNYLDLRADEREARRQKEFLKEDLSEIERLDDKQWEREKYLRGLDQEDKKSYYDVLKAVGTNFNTNFGNNIAGNIIYCSKCGRSCDSSSDFCPSCGNRLHGGKRCPVCLSDNDVNAKFCSNCSTKL